MRRPEPGLHGPELSDDIATGRWRTRTYECRRDTFNGSNWFPTAAFITKVASTAGPAGQDPDDQPKPEAIS